MASGMYSCHHATRPPPCVSLPLGPTLRSPTVSSPPRGIYPSTTTVFKQAFLHSVLVPSYNGARDQTGARLNAALTILILARPGCSFHACGVHHLFRILTGGCNSMRRAARHRNHNERALAPWQAFSGGGSIGRLDVRSRPEVSSLQEGLSRVPFTSELVVPILQKRSHRHTEVIADLSLLE
ncbi:hypothetical protein BV20DRAFT_63562 [Pilatotrama ljubarskyi]|nr:hypothetical protein BV20DRAFT_63562 [Pilatotrama ljubarskyi]